MKQNLQDLIGTIQPERILERISKNPRTTWNKKRQQLLASLSQRAQPIDEPSYDEGVDAM